MAANESEDFNKIDDGMIDFAKQMLKGFNQHALNVGTHGGDCTKMPAPCLLCTYEQILSDYREYYFGRIERIDDVERFEIEIKTPKYSKYDHFLNIFMYLWPYICGVIILYIILYLPTKQ